ncbi:MAG TPA: hypothetical protein VGR26_02745 [Acidimicrobiales bacterium]|nr:hypothetical protein [Acidimicrobiales bacterium]
MEARCVEAFLVLSGWLDPAFLRTRTAKDDAVGNAVRTRPSTRTSPLQRRLQAL